MGRLARFVEAEWAPALLIFFCDIVCWFALYAGLAFLRNDAYYTSGLELAIIDGLQLAVIVGCLFIIGGYSSRTDMRSLGYTAEHIIAMIAALGLSALAIYAAAAFDHVMRPSRSAVLVSFIAFTPLSLFYRRVLSGTVAKASANRAFLVIGAGQIAANFYKTYRNSPNQQRLEFVDVEKKRVGERIAGPGSPLIEGDLASKLNQASQRYSGIILAEGIGHIGPELLERLIRTQFQRTRVYTLESFYEAHWKRVPVHSVDPFWPLQTGFQQLARTSPYHYVKRIFDIVAAFGLLVLTFPLMVLIGVAIRLTNGQPVIFKQLRVGRDEMLFTIYKFRTMRVRGEADTEVGSSKLEARNAGGKAEVAPALDDIYTRDNDPRVLRLGRWLRKLRLDELPQLWNVLKGELSLIGPRAEWVQCAERYRKYIPFYHFRHLVKPGITGWAQVNYPYGESDEDAVEKLKYDLYYIRHYSLTLDAMIVLKTIYTMLFGKGR
ncbi:MAG TPA: exopolysaccharide biosynthesis polyprenyl glycosylphosphotransferase [Chthoniobacterales bacterium]|nr:exopolysaccharide biosynthesis polyprenyl glycosylphosphotransferase [Chthoniobacterales bacterium]